MKKLFVLALVLALLISGVAAEGAFDFSKMSDSALLELNSQLQQEIFSRWSSWIGVKVPQGVYLIGRDIPAGRFTITALEGTVEVAVSVRKANAEAWEVGDTYYLGTSYGTGTVNVDLEEGDTLQIQFADVSIRLYTSLFGG